MCWEMIFVQSKFLSSSWFPEREGSPIVSETESYSASVYGLLVIYAKALTLPNTIWKRIWSCSPGANYKKLLSTWPATGGSGITTPTTGLTLLCFNGTALPTQRLLNSCGCLLQWFFMREQSISPKTTKRKIDQN